MTQTRTPVVGEFVRIRQPKGINGDTVDVPFLITKVHDERFPNELVSGIGMWGEPGQLGWHRGTMEFSQISFGDKVHQWHWPPEPETKPEPEPEADVKPKARRGKLKAANDND